MAEIKVLVQGYAKQVGNGWKASSACCLIISDGKKIITDPGCNRKALLDALEKERLKTRDIDYVFLSHCHPDHILLAGIFENAKFVTYDGGLLYDGDDLIEFGDDILGKDIKIINTPGHVFQHISLLVDTSKGKIAVAGDVIWWLDEEEQVLDLNQKDHSEAPDMDMKKLIASRKKLLEEANFIIPGHGKIFKVHK